MEYIVLTQDQVEGLENLKSSFTGDFKAWSNYEPVAIKNNLWILPLSVMTDPDLKEFYEHVMENKTTDLIVREVTESEFYTWDAEGNRM